VGQEAPQSLGGQPVLQRLGVLLDGQQFHSVVPDQPDDLGGVGLAEAGIDAHHRQRNGTTRTGRAGARPACIRLSCIRPARIRRPQPEKLGSEEQGGSGRDHEPAAQQCQGQCKGGRNHQPRREGQQLDHLCGPLGRDGTEYR
jgi:hypothetical protein